MLCFFQLLNFKTSLGNCNTTDHGLDREFDMERFILESLENNPNPLEYLESHAGALFFSSLSLCTKIRIKVNELSNYVKLTPLKRDNPLFFDKTSFMRTHLCSVTLNKIRFLFCCNLEFDR